MRESMCLGPEMAKKLLRDFEKGVDERTIQSLAEALRGESQRLDDAFDHYGTVVILSRTRPSVSLFVDPRGRWILGMSYLDPSETASAPYKLETDVSSILETYSRVFGEEPQEVKVKIFQSPIRTPFVAVCGEKKLLGKILLKERLNASRFFGYAELVEDEVFDYLLSHHNRVQEADGKRFHVYCKGSNVYLTILREIESSDKDFGLFMAIAQYFKERLIEEIPNVFLKTEEYFKIPVEGRKTLTLRVPIEGFGSLQENVSAFVKHVDDTLEDLVSEVKEGINECLEKLRKMLSDS